MATFKLDIISLDGQLFSEEVESLVAPGSEGQVGILAHHAPMMVALQPGELIVRKSGEEGYLAVSGGFLEVRPDKVVILADAAERAEDIDLKRAEEARKRAEESLKAPMTGADLARTEAALRRSLVRLRTAEIARKRRKSST